MQSSYGFDGQVNAFVGCINLQKQRLISKTLPDIKSFASLLWLQVNEALLELLKASDINPNPNDWTNLAMEDPGYLMRKIASFGSSSSCIFHY
ncbi:hypothetical protein DY000_02027426 [Brassica cretica]|uniref:Uncharacterized protein n=1 Tax=Brassica cretica TaxID=69181 RepID=A0ABQ7E7L3_BRACR|nr:hypothetical protein DY000_02027426 [Brassica cretica]